MASYFLATHVQFISNCDVKEESHVADRCINHSGLKRLSSGMKNFAIFGCLICLHCDKLSSVHTQDNMKSLLSYIVSYYLRHFDEVSDDIYPPPAMKHFSLTSDYLPPPIHCDIL